MKIGIDFHGVIDDDIKLAKAVLTKLMIETLHIAIYVISGPPKVDMEKYLNGYGFYQEVHFDEVLSIVDFLKARDVKMWTDEKGRWWASDKDWWSSKAEICEAHNIDIMIDDNERYQQYFKNKKTKFLLYTR